MENLGLLDYLQYDGFSYRLVPILTPATDVLDIGRIDPAYTARRCCWAKATAHSATATWPIRGSTPTTSSSTTSVRRTHATHSPAWPQEYLRRGDTERAMQLLDRGLEVLPTSRIRFTESNTTPYLEAYYAAGILGAEDADAMGDALMREYIDTLIEYIEYYLRFDGIQADMVNDILSDKYNKLWNLYDLAVYAGRHEIVKTT